MPVVAVTALWLAASAPTAPESSDEPLSAPTAAGSPLDGRYTLETGKPPAATAKKPGSDNDEPGCEE